MATEFDSIKYLAGIGEKRATLFGKLGIDTVGALLRFYPRSYEDWSTVTPIANGCESENVCIKARVVTAVKENYIRKNMVLYKFTAADSTSSMAVTLFNNKYEAAKIHIGAEYLFYGKLSKKGFVFEMSSPQIRPAEFAIIRPVYSATAGLSSANLEKEVKIALTSTAIYENLPSSVIKRNALCSREYAIRNIHFPQSQQALKDAKKRLIFEELFLLQASLLFIKHMRRQQTPYILKNDLTEQFFSLLPYEMTSAQKRCIKDALSDMSSGLPMSRLIQGDVGSGKTAVAAACCFNAVKNGWQTVVMAPTEILAEQHFNTFKGIFADTDIQVELLTGSLTKKKKETVKFDLENGKINIIIGTHALLSDNVHFKRLGLAVTDEQHRFGVEQRTALENKGTAPHVLVMSATPIPRTLALIMHGDLDISVIDEYPKGRQAVETYCVGSNLHERVYNYIKKHIAEGRQGYIVCPLVEEGENISGLISAEQYFEKLKIGAFKDYRLGLLHGKMKSKEKDAVMREFSAGNIDLLISTTVIEVGVDVPNSAIMVIENAERFGLSQLHQLRGRIGRGKYKSTCILISDSKSAKDGRLKIMCETSDGFIIADKDLALRGPGDFLGNRQHGLPELRIANLEKDVAVLRMAASQANALLQSDPLLQSKENATLKEELCRMVAKMKNN